MLSVIAALRLAWAAGPVVARTSPADGAIDVAPGLAWLEVEFDQPMAQGSWSWVGGGETFPEMRGSPEWIDEDTCRVRVWLEPDRAYRVGFNSERHQGFRSLAGEPAVPAFIAFHTADVRIEEDPEALARQAAADAIAALKDKYAYRDLRAVDWPALLGSLEADLREEPDPAKFARLLAERLAALRDPHVWASSGGRPYASFDPDLAPNFRLALAAREVPGLRQLAPAVHAGRWPDGVGYLLIDTWRGEAPGTVPAALAAIQELRDAPGIVLDVRPNTGGDERLASEIAALFLDEERVYAQRRPGPGAPAEPRALAPAPEPLRYGGKVAVLMGPANLSSAESFLLMMRQAPRARLFGARSAGSSGNPRPIPLANGVVLHLPSWQAMDADGVVFEGVGIAPDVEVPATKRDLRRGDPVLAAALEWIRGE